MAHNPQLDVLALGELLIDMFAADTGDLVAARRFEKAAGGAPANVAVGVNRLGRRGGFVGCVGDDAFGRFLRLTLEGEGVNTDGLVSTKHAPTTLALVSRAEDGERDFQFYRNPGADTLLSAESISDDLLRSAKILHVGSLSLTDEPARSATLDAVARAQSFGLTVSCDPNLREPLWRGDLLRARTEIAGLIRQSNVIKLSQDELRFMTNSDELGTAAAHLWHPNLKLLVVSLGPRGCWFRCASGQDYVAGFNVAAIDTTGAGDSFVAGLLVALLDLGVDLMTPDMEGVKQALRWANAAGALATTRLGAIPALPTSQQVQQLVASR